MATTGRRAEHLAPLDEALVRGQDHVAALVASGDQGEEGCRGRAIIRPDAELVDDQHLGREVDAEPAIDAVLGLGPAEVLHQMVGAGEIDAGSSYSGFRIHQSGSPSSADVGWNPGASASTQARFSALPEVSPDSQFSWHNDGSASVSAVIAL